MKRVGFWGMLFMLFVLRPAICTAATPQYTQLRSFSSAPDAQHPDGALTLSGSTIYGTTSSGGSPGYGTIFSMHTDGSGFQILHNFTRTAIDGGIPQAALTLSGSRLFGTTFQGGASGSFGRGTVFSIDTDGSGFQILHSFNGDDGRSPNTSVAVDGVKLYGTTPSGGSPDDDGTIFSMNIDGSGFQTHHTFTSIGARAPNSLTLIGSKLYGTTIGGAGGLQNGTVFSMNTDGSGFQILHSFSGIDGIGPFAGLTLSNSKLYGTAHAGGAANAGTAFSINLDGSGFQTLHNFTGSGGRSPRSLTASASRLYGTTFGGGSSNEGTAFEMNFDGSEFQVLHHFARTGDDGQNPDVGLTLSDATLYGATYAGGADTYGTIFAITVPEPSTFILAAIGLAWLAWRVTRRIHRSDRRLQVQER